MLESIFQTFILLSTFDMILISVTIANFAVSASYLGRETRLTRRRMEKRKQELSEKIKELQKKGLSIAELKKETEQAEHDIDTLSNRIFFLSWVGAVILPCGFFIVSLLFATYGMNVEVFERDVLVQGAQEQGLLEGSAALIALGFFILLGVIGYIDSAARRLPVPEFEVYYENETKTIESKRNTKISFLICIRNKGEDTAEDLVILFLFPPSFKPQPSEHYELMKQARIKGIDFPNYTSVTFRRNSLHVETVATDIIEVMTPDETKLYEIPVYIYERETGLTKDKLTIQVVD